MYCRNSTTENIIIIIIITITIINKRIFSH